MSAPSPFTVTKNGLSYRVELDVHYISEAEMQTLRKYITTLNDENEKLREELSDVPKCESCEAMLDCDECLRADASQKERKRLDYENAKLRELVEDMLDCIEIRAAWHRPPTEGMCEEFAQRARDLGMDNDDDDWGSDGIRE